MSWSSPTEEVSRRGDVEADAREHGDLLPVPSIHPVNVP